MKSNTRTDQATNHIAKDTTSEISKVAVSTIGISTGLIGVWAVACIIAGISSSGGPIDLFINLFKTISGQ
jgi:hypothetical protein